MKIRAAAVALLGCSLLALDARADGLEHIDAFKASNIEMQVMTYEKNGKKIGMLGIIASHKVAITFYREEWLQLIELFKKASAAAPTAGEWPRHGELRESSDASDPSKLTIRSGQGVAFTVESTKIPAATFILPRGEFARFQATLDKVTDSLSAQPK
jgi:hypothetical protein